jgi:alkylation response protein AidB-like acyl-CoA dehydrogenase
MDLTLTEDQELIRSTAAEFVDEWRAKAGAAAVAREPGGHSTQLWHEMTSLGWPGIAIDEAHGGVGSGFLEACLLIEQLGRAAIPSPFLTSVACCAPAIARFGSEAQQREWLGAVASGTVLAHVDGPDLTSDGSTVDGLAELVPYAAAATALLVATGDRLLVVDAAAPAVEPLDVVGIDPRYRVRFDGTPVREVLDARRPREWIAAYGAVATCVAMVGGAQGVLDATVAYAQQREQFGKPIGAFQAVQHHCANMAIDVLGARFTAYEAAWRLGAGLPAATEVAVAKSYVSEAYQRVCALGHQVHGAIGFTAEHDLHHYTRHAMSAALSFGDATHHTEELARILGI